MMHVKNIPQESGEAFDALDGTGAKTGKQVSRSEAHRNGTWHGSFHCLIMLKGRGAVLFQKRSARKLIAPGKFDVSVGGHYGAGEDARRAGPREIREELGLDARFGDMLPLGRRIFVHCFTEGVVEQEFQDVFLLERDLQPESLVLQQEEVDGVLVMSVEEGIALFSGKAASMKAVFHGQGKAGMPVQVSAGDFVPNIDNYYLKLLLLVRRYLNGERELLLI